MSDQNKVIVILVSAFFALIAVLIISTAVYHSAKNTKISEMVKNGADPILASCALDNIYFTQCQLYFVNKK